MWKEFIGIGATLFILVGMCFKTTTYKGSLCLRSINIIGSIIFVVYGALVPAISTAVLNGLLVLVHTYHIVKLVKDHKKEQKPAQKNTEENQEV